LWRFSHTLWPFDNFLSGKCIDEDMRFIIYFHEILENYTILSVNVTKFHTYPCYLAKLVRFYGYLRAILQITAWYYEILVATYDFTWNFINNLWFHNKLQLQLKILHAITTHLHEILCLLKYLGLYCDTQHTYINTVTAYLTIQPNIGAFCVNIVTLWPSTETFSDALWHSTYTY